MSTFDFLPIVPLEVVIAAVLVVATVAATRRLRARGRASRRVVEKPNSYYTSRLARNNETRHRWSHIALDRLHEVNRAEVVRLLAKVEATSIDALRANEVAFLDRMAELADTRVPAPPGGMERPPAPDLRHRPA